MQKEVLNDKLQEYYELKKNYEKGYYDKYVKPISENPTYSKVTKRRLFQELKKPLCINCKQPVGTIFERKYYRELNDKTEVIVFTAKCGNTLNPCELNIEIHKSKRDTYATLINDASKKLYDFQMKIIKLKNQILFLGKGVANKDEYINEFNEYKTGVLRYSEMVGEFIEENIMMNDNPEENEKLKYLISSLNQNEIMVFNKFINEYLENSLGTSETSVDNILSNAMNMYIKDIQPKIEEIRNLKYKTMYVNFDQKENVYKLIQSKTSDEEMHYYDESIDEVVSFVKGFKLDNNPIKSKLKISDLEGEESKRTEDSKRTEESKKSKKSKTLKSIKSSKSRTMKKPLKITETSIQEQEQEQEQTQNQIQELDDDIQFINDSDDDIFTAEPTSQSVRRIISDEEESKSQLPVNKNIKKIGNKIVINEETEANE
jgi:hypothetical protein